MNFMNVFLFIDHIYSSPSLRCVQTCSGFLRGYGRHLKIKIEPGLFEWTAWHAGLFPRFMSPHELLEAGYGVDAAYEPMVCLSEHAESCEEFYARSAFVARGALERHAGENVLLLGHAATLETCSRQLLGRKARSVGAEMTKVIRKVSV